MESGAGPTALLVVNHEYWSQEIDLGVHQDGPTVRGNPHVCKNCGEVLDWHSPPRTCQCCTATVCAKHSGHAEMHVARGQDGGGLFTFCTDCLDALRVPEHTVLTAHNTHINSKIPPTFNPFATVPPETSSSLPPSSSLSSPSSSSVARPASYLRHRKCDESPWRDCSSLFGSARRNRLPLGQPSATRITRTAEGELPLSLRGATPAAVDIRVRWCSHQRRVSCEEAPFRYSKRAKAGDDPAWVEVSESVIRSSRRKDVNVSLLRWKSDEDNAEDGGSSGEPSPPTSSSTKRVEKPTLKSILKPDGGVYSSNSSNSGAPFSSGSLIFPVPSKKEGWDGWSSPPPEPGPTRRPSANEEDDNPKAIGKGEGEGAGQGPPPSSTKPSGYFANFPKMAGGALAVVGVVATVGVMVLRLRR